MTDMIERVARKIELGRLLGESDTGIARVILKAIREPTKEMLMGAGTMEGFDADIEEADYCHTKWWQDMIDTALTEEKADG